ncbi:uncharacterized protein BCR38DRAFT_5122 [Pseudomassariella vexata]|uniref:Uncharacterized protein n=1 Tax=Pseudomassariella vexata TaxID=1141098 RepID=A0A1Y2EIX6_9PEZI|nr:uncharacterized protein BCR38DRAFT_5122 [Pseudomassariella vexata]ORY71196.1 hypothetical protein BCR38DRAFT_5122 [Pseudomassariella vexata]
MASSPTPPPAPATPSAPKLPTTPDDAAATTGKTFENRMLHNVALGVTPVALGAMFLPPRRLDFRMLILGGCSIWGINQLRYDYTGKTFLQRFPSFGGSSGGGGGFFSDKYNGMPSERAQQVQAQIKEEKKRRLELAAAREGMSEEDARKIAEQRRERERKERSTLKAIWMGDADEDWKEKRDQREREALKEGGKGYWGLIMEQISDVRDRGKGDKTNGEGTNEEPKKS